MKEYWAKFQELVAEMRDWLESMKVTCALKLAPAIAQWKQAERTPLRTEMALGLLPAAKELQVFLSSLRQGPKQE